MKDLNPLQNLSTFSKPYIIAEIGVNHEGSLSLAHQLIDQAKMGGADAAKFQTYKADKLAMRDSPAYWDQSEESTPSQWELFKKYDALSTADYRSLAAHCRDVGINFMSTPFDLEAVDDLRDLVHIFKVASADIDNVPLLRKVGQCSKPVVLSTGASDISEIERAVHELRTAGAPQIVLLHCILAYPTREEDANLLMITHLVSHFPDLVVGISDHTVPTRDNLALVTAYALGARVIEKHFTHDRSLPGNDHYHAMDADGLTSLVSTLDRSHKLLGSTLVKGPVESEQNSRKFARRSICVVRDIEPGHQLEERDLICLRPGTGISSSMWDDVIGSTTTHFIAAGTALDSAWLKMQGSQH